MAQMILQRIPARTTHNIADKENFHRYRNSATKKKNRMSGAFTTNLVGKA
jgi:hypothetical protein